MKNQRIALIIAFTIALPISSFALNDKPICPSINAIQDAGLNFVAPGFGGWYLANLKNKYDTNNEWSFLIIVPNAEDEADALKKGNDILNLSTFNEGPLFNEKTQAWECGYIYTSPNGELEVGSFATTTLFKV